MSCHRYELQKTTLIYVAISYSADHAIKVQFWKRSPRYQPRHLRTTLEGVLRCRH